MSICSLRPLFAALIFPMVLTGAGALAQSTAPAAVLSGTVSSATEGKMEGVLVSAQKQGSPIRVTVTSDEKGHFEFPADRLSPGSYALSIRAIGYELEAPQSAAVPATAGGGTADITLRKATDISAQMTNTEWFMSLPGTPAQKQKLIECMSCHTLERIVRSTFTSDDFVPLLKRMANYANNTTQALIQPRPTQRMGAEDQIRKAADYLASINLSHGTTWSYPLKTLPRPSGAATRAIITEYELPRATIAPHDVRTDSQGNIWYSDFVEQNLGMLDPRTGAVTEYAYPVQKRGFPMGSLDLEPDPDGNLWLAMMFQTGLAKFDMKAKTFQLFPVGPEQKSDPTMQQSMVMPGHWKADNKVWSNDVNHQEILRLDLATGRYETIDPFANMPKSPSHGPYGMMTDADNNLYFLDFGGADIGKVDAKTGRPTIYPTPTKDSWPRRGMLDDKGRLWFAEFAANKLGMFDTKSEKFKEWNVPTAHTYPYDVSLDRTGQLWSGGMASDRVLRFDPASGKSVEYLLPSSTNIRRIFVDNSTNPPTLWAGNNHHATIFKLEVRD